jgi:hypothetical protein
VKPLRDLRPAFGAVTGFPGRFFLLFDCMTTDRCRVYVQFHRGPEEPGVWQCTSPWRIFSGIEHLGEQPDLDSLTLLPSIADHAGPKRGVRCPGHVNITNGVVVSSPGR